LAGAFQPMLSEAIGLEQFHQNSPTAVHKFPSAEM
jgi:hypothetical protein